MSMRTTNARVIAVVAAAAALTCAAATTAAGAAGATGSVDIVNSHFYGAPDQAALRVAGWAYNRHTVYVEQVRVLSYNSSDRLFNITYLTATKSRPDVVRAGAATTPYVGFDSTFLLSQLPEKVCIDTHDLGETAGWVRLSCRYVTTTCSSARPVQGLTPVRSFTLKESEALARGC
jgi:ABC-type glycerol-3-phosphate transport system substrate-binding protein